MSVYISMEMPKPKLTDMATIYNAYILVSPDGHAAIVVDNEDGLDSTEYSLVPLPEHGRLIDADAFTDAIDSIDWYHQAPNKEMVHGANPAEHQAWYKEQDIFAAVENAPTVIPEDEVV